MAVTFDKAPASRLGTNTTFTLTTASQATAAVGAQTYQVRVATNSQVVGCFIKVGEASGVTASSGNDAMIGSNVVDYVTVTPGQKVAVLGQTAAGIVTITEMQ